MQEQLSEKQIEKLRLVGYTLQQGKRNVEDKQAALDARPLVASEIEALASRVRSLQEEMRTDFLRRDKLRTKLAKAEQELKHAEKQLERLRRKEQETFKQLEEQLGSWLNEALRASLGSEQTETLALADLLQASQRVANRRWGSDLGRLQRQPYARFLEWIEKLKRYPDLVAFMQEVGRQVQQFKAVRKKGACPPYPRKLRRFAPIRRHRPHAAFRSEPSGRSGLRGVFHGEMAGAQAAQLQHCR